MSTSNFAKPKKGNMAIYIILIIIVIASMVALKQCPGNMRHEVQTNSVNDTINVAIEYSPLSLYTYNDTLGGFSYDFMRMVEKHSGYKFIFHPFVKLEDALKALNKHEYDMVIAQFPITKENRDKYLFSNALYLDNQVLIQQKDSLGNVPIKSQLDIANDTVYIVKGSPMRSRLENLSHEIGDTIYIIDDNFRNYCLSLCDSNKDGMITKTEAESVTEMVIPAEVRSVQGIEYFTKLSSLDINESSLTILDASKNAALTYIHIPYTLKALNVSGCMALKKIEGTRETFLEYLNLGDTNPLYVGSSGTIDYLEIAIAHGTKFKLISSKLTRVRLLTNNQMSTIDVSGCVALESLHIGRTMYSASFESDYVRFSAKDCRSLSALTFESGYNKLTDIDVSGCSMLKTLDCSNRMLMSLNVDGCVSLTALNCAVNRLTVLNVSGCSALQTLNCYSNNLSSLNVGNAPLTTLKCYSNQLTSLDVSKTNLGNSSNEYPLDCAPMETLKTLYLKTSWNINGITENRSSTYIPTQTEILFKD